VLLTAREGQRERKSRLIEIDSKESLQKKKRSKAYERLF